MRLLKAQHLLPQTLCVSAEKVCAGGREVGAIVNRVDSAERILRRMNVVQPHRSEVIPYGLQRIVECFRDSAKVRSTRTLYRPDRQQRRNPSAETDICKSRRRTGIWGRSHNLAGQKPHSRIVVGNKVHACLVQMLAKSFVVAEEKCLILLERPAE